MKSKQSLVATSQIYWVTSTHWDREWYMTFQDFRFRLVSLLDEVFERMTNDPRFSHFQLDGQAIPLEDYLEVRPEKEDLIFGLISSGRLKVGPWYTMPDEFIISGESIIRNLQIGMSIAHKYGESSHAGFICDVFGHISQLPQIFNLFHIQTAFLWRGIDPNETGRHFKWRSPDGSQLLVHRFGPHGYSDYDFFVRKANNPDYVFKGEQELERTLEYIRHEEQRGEPGMPVLIFDGGDHLEIEPTTPDLIDRIKTSDCNDTRQISMATLDQYSQAILEHEDRITQVYTGELREPGKTLKDKPCDIPRLLSGVMSSRIPIKQTNTLCESILTQWAEPFSVFASTYGLEYPRHYLTIAWKLLISNHAHDSICGCSIDRVHQDMLFRFNQVLDIARRLMRNALETLGRSIVAGLDKTHPHDAVIVLFNPTNRTIDEPIDFDVKVPLDTPCFHEFMGREPKPAFRLFDSSGNELPYQRTGQKMNQAGFAIKRRKFPLDARHHSIQVSASHTIPPFGYTTVFVKQEKEATRYETHGLRTGMRSAENEFISLHIDSNGLLNIHDKQTGHDYNGLLELEDRADVGDGWNWGPAVNDEIQMSGATGARVSCLCDGPLQTTFKIELDWLLPEAFDFNQMRRCEKRRVMRVVHEITLRAGCRRVEAITKINNQIKDHRLRLIFPTNIQADEFWTDSAFDCISQSIKLNPQRLDWYEMQDETRAQQSWTAIAQQDRGLAVICPDLIETSVCDLDSRPIALTLLRATSQTVFTNGEPDGQLQQDLTYRYWIKPFDGRLDASELCLDGQQLMASIGQTQLSTDAGAYDHAPLPYVNPYSIKPLPPQMSFLRVDGNFVVTAVNLDDHAHLFIRLFNPTESQQEGRIIVHMQKQKAYLCTLNGDKIEELAIVDQIINVNVKGKQIINVRID